MGFSETTISVKAVHAGDIRRFPFPVEGGHALLQQKLNELFNFAPPQELKVYWQDEQNDQVTPHVLALMLINRDLRLKGSLLRSR
jgi:hypothetical protein